MRLLERKPDGDLVFREYTDKDVPAYAILSHTWLPNNNEEVSFQDLEAGTGKSKAGWKKIEFCADKATADGLQYFWIDTCCINKSNKAEEQKSINSMFCWYRNATRCYVYLSDVPTAKQKQSDPLAECTWESAFRASRWFTRGWTLQELLAPASVEFFSYDGKRLGDKSSSSLQQQICEVTGVPASALQGARLSQFSNKERFSWIQCRQTNVEEDRAYSLLGIFDIEMPLRYGEGSASAFERLEKEIDKLNKCLRDLRPTDPRDDKKRIEETKGGLLEDSYRWILDNADFQRWRRDWQSPLLWIKGDPGKGKTVLLCGIIDELDKSTAKTALLSYFFCQATDSRINNATAVLRGLMYMLVCQQPSLISYILKKYDHAGKNLFDDVNVWVALVEIFMDMLRDPNLSSTYLIIDALDECVTADLPKLLNFIVQSSTSSHIKWIVSSRNWPDIEERLKNAGQNLSLELNAESVSTAVKIFIQYKVLQLGKQKSYNDDTRLAVSNYLSSKANDTFLWVALVCQTLEKIPRWKTLAKLGDFPPGLNDLYGRMVEQIRSSDDATLCKRILATIALVYRPLTLKELASVVETPKDTTDDLASLREIVGLCGSLLTIREDTIYFVHQSAKDYLLTQAFHEIFPSGKEDTHYSIFSKSLPVMSKTLRRDIYSLQAPGYPIEQVKQPHLDPLAASRYSCVYWIDHLLDCDPTRNATNDLQADGSVDSFLRRSYLYWLEALSLCGSMSKGVVSVARLEALFQAREGAFGLFELVKDARRFIMSHKLAIEKSPLQVYTSALVFSPARSLIRGLFQREEPKWITIKPAIGDNWNACLQTLEGHSNSVTSAAFLPNGAQLASVSYDGTVKIWDANSGECLQTLEGHSGWVTSVAFSPNGAQLASASHDRTVKIWDSNSGECLQALEGHSHWVTSVAFSPNGAQLASASCDGTVKIWDVNRGECLQTLEGNVLDNILFDATGSYLYTEIWDVAVDSPSTSNEILDGVACHNPEYQSVGLSANGEWITWNSENLIWLPSEYRPSCSAVSWGTVGIGIGSGRVWMCTVNGTGFGHY